MADLFVLPRPAKSVQNGAGFSGKIEHTGPAEKKRVASVPQREQLTSTPEPPLPKEKEQIRLSKAPNCMVNESQGEQEPHLGEGEGDQAGAWRGKGELHNEGRQVPKR